MRAHLVHRGMTALLSVAVACCVPLGTPAVAYAGDGYPGPQWDDAFRNTPVGQTREGEYALCEQNGGNGTFVAEIIVSETRRDRYAQFLSNGTGFDAQLTLSINESTTQQFSVSASAEAALEYITATLQITYSYSVTRSQGATFQYTVPAYSRANAHYGDTVKIYDLVLWEWGFASFAPGSGPDACFISRTRARVEAYVETGSWIDPPQPLS